MGTKYKNKKPVNTISLYMIGMIVAGVITILCAAAMASLVVKDILSENVAIRVIPIVHFIAMFFGTYVAGSRADGNLIMNCAITSLIYYLTAITITVFWFGGAFSNMLLGTAAIFSGAAAGSIISLRRKKRTPRRKHRVRTC